MKQLAPHEPHEALVHNFLDKNMPLELSLSFSLSYSNTYFPLYKRYLAPVVVGGSIFVCYLGVIQASTLSFVYVYNKFLT